MSIATSIIYKNDPVNGKRTATDKLFINNTSKNNYSGQIDKAIKYIEKIQLLDADLWKRFVDQYREKSDSADRGWRGEYWGKMMRGAAFTYSYTRDPELYSVLTETVIDMLSTEDEQGRISTYQISDPNGFGEFNGWDIWSRKYVLLGMEYYLEICNDEALKRKITDSLCRQTDYLISKLGSEAEGKKSIVKASNNWRGLNSTSILEPIVRLYSLTGEKRFLDFAEYIISEGGTSIFNLFEKALSDTTDPYQYPITKAYEMMSCFEGILEYYRVTGIQKYKTMVLNFARRVMETDVTIIGCCGTTSEYFDHSSARQTDSTYKGHMQETCVTVTWMKFCLQLLAFTGDPKFADLFEQSLYNAYLGSINTHNAIREDVLLSEAPEIKFKDIMPFDSYSSLLGGTRGIAVGGLRVMRGGHYYSCCTCIGSAGTGMISKAASMLSENGIAVNLYIPGCIETMMPSGKALTIKTETEYPMEGKIHITLLPEQDEEFELKLRIPQWSEKTVLSVCGDEITAEKGYTSVSRTWRSGDTIDIELDMRAKLLRPVSNPRDLVITDVVWGSDYIVPRVTIASDDAEYRLAIRRGPLVLARDARLGENVLEKIDLDADDEDIVQLEPSHTADFDTLVEFKATTDNGKKITLIDYASAGKTWDESSTYVCWLPTNKKYSK